MSGQLTSLWEKNTYYILFHSFLSHLKNVFSSSFIKSGFVFFLIVHFPFVATPCNSWCWLSTHHSFKKGFFPWKGVNTHSHRPVKHRTPVNYFISLSPYALAFLPSWTVEAIGFRVKSGVDFPAGSISTNWVIITPGTLDLFLIATVKIRNGI